VVRINPVRLKVVLLGSKNFQQLVRFGAWFVAAQNRVGGERSANERFWSAPKVRYTDEAAVALVLGFFGLIDCVQSFWDRAGAALHPSQ
jgi:hypothetical protein